MSRIPIIVFCPRDISGGSQNYWRNLIAVDGFLSEFELSIVAENNASTIRVAEQLKAHNIAVAAYPRDKVQSRFSRALNAFSPLKRKRQCQRSAALDSELKRRTKGVVWFILDSVYSIAWCEDAINVCKEREMPFHLIVQHVPELVHFESEELCNIRYNQLASANRVIFVSQRNREVAELGLGRELRNAQLGVNGLTKRTFDEFWSRGNLHPPQTSGTARFLNLSRFDISFKGQNLLLAALNCNQFVKKDWLCRFVGGGQDRWMIERLVRNIEDASGRFEVLDRQEPADSLFFNSDLFILPSYSEGMAFALVEAAAACRPLVATDVAGARDIAIPLSTGFLAPATTVDSVRATLIEAWESRELWPKMGIAAHEIAREMFCLDSFLERVRLDNLSDLK